MPGSDPNAERTGRAADFVQSYEAIVSVERRVFNAFCHHRASILLHAHGEANNRLFVEAALGAQFAAEQPVKEIEYAGVDRRVHPAGARDGPGEVALVGLLSGPGIGVEVATIDGKARDDRLQRPLQQRPREIGCAARLTGDARGIAAKRAQLARELVFQDSLLRNAGRGDVLVFEEMVAGNCMIFVNAASCAGSIWRPRRRLRKS